MGGNNPLIVTKTINIDAAVYHTIQSTYISSKQRCTCGRRLFVPSGKEGDEFIKQWEKQNQRAERLYQIMSAFAKVGIDAFIDEITGYQEVRERDELSKLLAKYLSAERLAWAKMFNDEFYKQIYRLKEWDYPTGATKKTPYIGKITNQIVYEKLPPGGLQKLQEKKPVIINSKKRKWKHFQFLSEDLGQPDLRDHLLQVIMLMRISNF